MSGRQNVTFSSTNKLGDCTGVLFGAEPGKAKPGLVVLHGFYGLEKITLEQGKMIAEQGDFVVLVPDWFRGKVTQSMKEGAELIKNMDWAGAQADIAGAAQFLKQKGYAEKVGVVGNFTGGSLALLGALLPDFSAAATFYGIPPHGDLTKIKIPVQGHFGLDFEIEGRVIKVDYLSLKDKLLAAGVNFELFEYQTNHGFTRQDMPNYSKELATLALGRMYDFMHKHLK